MSSPTPQSDETLDNKECTGCRIIKPLDEFTRSNRTKSGYIARCRDCNAAKSRWEYDRFKEAYRAVRRAYTKKNWDAIKQNAYARAEQDKEGRYARHAVNNAVLAGKFKKQPCTECDATIVDFHHTNGYNEPNWFVGQWLCRKHHAALHRRLRDEKKFDYQTIKKARGLV